MNRSRMCRRPVLVWALIVLTVPWCLGTSWADEPAASGEETVIKARVVGESLPLPPAPAPQNASTSGPQPLIPKLSAKELQMLVAPVALYPDEVVDHVLEAAQHPAAIHQAASLHQIANQGEAAKVIRDDLPRSVVYLLDKYPQVLVDLDKDLLMTARLGSAMKAQPEDVVAAIREVRAQSAALQAQQGVSASDTVSVSNLLPYYARSGAYAGTSYPCYCYYTNGLPCTYYASYGYPYYYPYGALAWNITRLTLGIIYLANGPYYYGYYPYPYYPYPYWGYWGYYGPYPYPYVYAPYTYSTWANTYAGTYGSATHYGSAVYGPYGGMGYAGSTTGAVTGPRGTTTFTTYGRGVTYSNGVTSAAAGQINATVHTATGNTINVAGAGLAGKTTVGNTTFGGAAGSVSWASSNGNAGTASGWATGSATVVGNSTSWHTQAAGSVQTNTGISAVGTHSASGSLVAYQDGSYGYNRNSTNTLTGAQGSVTVDHSATGNFTGGGTGSFSGSTTITGSNGGQATITTTYENGQLTHDVTKNPPTQTAAKQSSITSNSPSQRLSGQTGADSRFGSQSLAGMNSPTAVQSGGSTVRPWGGHQGAAGAVSSTRLGERYGGYGALNPNQGAVGNATVRGSGPGLGPNSPRSLSNNAGSTESSLGSSVFPNSGALNQGGFGSRGSNTPALGGSPSLGGSSIRGQSPSFNNPSFGSGSNFGGGARSSSPSMGSSIGGSRGFSGGSIGGGSFGGGGRGGVGGGGRGGGRR